jgi:hypothetical protein
MGREAFLFPYVEWNRFVTLTGAQAGYVIVSISRSEKGRIYGALMVTWPFEQQASRPIV